MPSIVEVEPPLWRRLLRTTWTVVGGGVVLAVCGLYTWDDRLNKPAVEASAFFHTLGKRGPDAAYARAAPEFRAAIDSASFAQMSAESGLDRATGGGWNDRRFSASTADMGGVIYQRDHGRLPSVVRMVRHGLFWKVSGLEVPGEPPIGPPAPDIDRRPLGGPSVAQTRAAQVAAYPSSPPTARAPDVDAATGVVIAHPPVLGPN